MNMFFAVELYHQGDGQCLSCFFPLLFGIIGSLLKFGGETAIRRTSNTTNGSSQQIRYNTF